jgi:hypothetical protein
VTYAEAVDLRSRQLAGASIAPELIARAIAVIKAGRPMRRGGRPSELDRGLPRDLLKALVDGPMERDDFYALAARLYQGAGRKKGPYSRINQMMNEGWIVAQVVLTPEGMQKVGAES